MTYDNKPSNARVARFAFAMRETKRRRELTTRPRPNANRGSDPYNTSSVLDGLQNWARIGKR